jgi:3-hydroxybutyryl-CoA dehydrogenase
MASIEKLGVIGAGLMGNGIAHVAALSGLAVTMVDVNPAALERRWAPSARTWTVRYSAS